MTCTDSPEPLAIPLDEAAHEAARKYLAAVDERNEAEARRLKAKDILVDFFRRNGCEIGTVDGAPLVRLVRSDSERFDESRFRNEQPLTYRRYLEPSTVYYVRRAR